MRDKFKKQPSEKFFVSARFYDQIRETETIDLTNSSVTVVDKDGNDVTSTIVEAGTLTVDTDPIHSDLTTMLSVRVQAGSEAASPYKIHFLCQTDLGNIWELDVWMTVKENEPLLVTTTTTTTTTT